MAGLCSCSSKSARGSIDFTGFQEQVYGFGIWGGVCRTA